MAADRPRSRPSNLVIVVLLCALAVGAAASIVVAARAAAPFVPSSTPELYLSNGIVILFLGLLFGAIILAFLQQRIGSGSVIPGRAIITSLVAVLGLVLFVVLYRYIQGSANTPAGNGNSSGGGGASGGSGPPSGPSLGGGGGTFEFAHLPSWTLFAVIAILSVVVAALVVPRVRTYLIDRREKEVAPSEEQEVRQVLGRAAERLAAGSDARGVILQLYAELLGRVAPLAGNIDPSTPEEIRTQHLIRLGIRPEAASQLTRLFEEARYSSHPLGPEATARASQAITTAEADLRRAAPLP